MSSYRASSRSWIAGLLAAASTLLLVIGPRAAFSAASPRPAAQPHPAGVFLNEFLPQPISDWNDDGTADEGDEYIELYNANAFDVDLSGWMLDDVADSGSPPYTLPPGTLLRAQRHLVLFRSETGIELADGDEGDDLRLLTPDGALVESHSHAGTVADGAYSKTSDGGGAWTTAYPPSPGAANQAPGPPTATPTGTATFTPSATPTNTPTPTPNPPLVSLNEFMPNPEADWNGDGITGDGNDEYIELYNPNDYAVDIGGWKVDDVSGGSAPYTIPAGTTLSAHSFLPLWSRDTNIALNNSGGDWVRLLRPDGTEVESHSYTAAPADGAYSKTVDGGSQWTTTYPPSPGASNQPAPTPTATPTSPPYPTGVSLNEFMPDPDSDWNDSGIADEDDEYIELYNANAFDVDIGGWKLDDVASGGTQPYTLPAGTTLRAQRFLVLFRAETGIALNNSGGDAVRLLTPDGVEVESTTYTQTRPDEAYSKSVDGGDDWVRTHPPSPGASNQPAAWTTTPTPTATHMPSPTATATPALSPTPYPDGVFLNEFMPNPEADWNGDGIEGDGNDEYIELYNANDFEVDLSGWQVDDAAGSSAPYTLPAGTVIQAQGFLVFWSRDTGIALNNSGGDSVRLLTPDGVEVESYPYTAAPADGAHSKTTDGGGEWTVNYPPSPGASNQPPAWTATPTATARPSTTTTPTPTRTPTPAAYPTGISLNEFMPNPEADWNGDGITGDGNDEYIELHNANDFAVTLGGWQVDDVAGGGSTAYSLPPGTTLPAGGFLALWSRDTGIALNNSGGDSVRLLRPDGLEVESATYTAAPADAAYGKTTDGGGEWTMDYPPSPGASNQPGATPTSTPTATPGVYPDGVSLNEYMPDPASDWNGDGAVDQEDEYVELYNGNDVAVDVSGWRLDDVDDGANQPRWLFGPDGSPPYTLPAGATIPARGFLLLFRSETGIALNNDGDQVRLLRPDGVVVEATGYDASRNDEAHSKTADGGAEWTTAYPPSPGASNQPAPTPTPTATPTPTPTLPPIVYPTGISLNEYMPNPEADWNGDGILGDENDEYVELYNANAFAVDLSGWQVDDADGGSQPYTLPAGSTVPAQGFLTLWRRESGVALNNSGGDSVRLLRPDGAVAESHAYTAAPADGATSKTVDGGAEWTMAYPPSPGASNQPAPPTPTPTATPTATPGVYPEGVSLNEYMPDPASDWNGSGMADENDEYIELYNAGDVAVDLSGWRLDDVDDGFRYGAGAYSTDSAAPDGSPAYPLPPGTILPARGFLLVFRSQSGIALNNDGDWVRLLRPDGAVVEAVEYSSSRDDQAASKVVDGGSEWTRSYPPSPGGSNTPGGTPTPTPSPTPPVTPTPFPTTVRLNEVLPSPRDVDWDGNGVASYLDEWIELTNLGDEPVNLAGWRLADGQPAGHDPAGVYILPAGFVLPARGHLLLFRAQSGLGLDASDEWLRLLYPDGSEADALRYDVFSGYDQSWCRLPDGSGDWSRFCIETPGQANQADPNGGGSPGGGSGSAGGGAGSGQPYDRFNYDLLPIAQARGLPDRTRVTLEGQVTVLPNVFDDQNIYMEDASGGMLVYLRSGEWPPLSEGQWVRVNGRLDTFYGEREISLVRIDDIKTMQPAAPPPPLPIRTGEMNEANEGRLAQISGAITGYWQESTLYLDDGSGEARVTIKASTGIRRPYVQIGETWTAAGVVSQSESGYRLLPRRESDLQRSRATGARARAATAAAASAPPADDMAWNRAPIYLPITGAVLTVRPPVPATLWEAWLSIR